jgi:hypothetical protein
VSELLQDQAERSIAHVVESECPLCHVELHVHAERACCSSSGDSYRVSTDRLDVRQCPEHGRRCEHWEAIWSSRSAR